MSEAALITRTFGVGKDYRVTLTIPKFKPGAVLCMSAEWEPRMPKKLSASEIRAYRRGRDAVLVEVAQITGVSIAVVG